MTTAAVALLIISAMLLTGCDFTAVGSPAISNGRVVFGGGASYPTSDVFPLGVLGGIYLHDGTHLRAVVEVLDIRGRDGVNYFQISTPPAPGGGRFMALGAPAIDEHGSVVFAAQLVDGRHGVYVFDGQRLAKVVDSRDDIPGGGATFDRFDAPSISDGRIVFTATARQQNTTWPAGVYLYQSGVLTAVADRNTQVPGGPETFKSFGPARIHGTRVLFSGAPFGVDTKPSVFLFDGQALTVVADTNTVIPDGPNGATFDSFGPVAVSSEFAVFVGKRINTPTSIGVYGTDGHSLARVVDKTMIQANGFPFSNFTELSLDGADVYFGEPGFLYRVVDGSIETVIDTQVTLPVVGRPNGITGGSASSGQVAFAVNPGSGKGGAVFTKIGQQFTLVAGPQTPIPSVLLPQALSDLHRQGIISEREYREAGRAWRGGRP